MFGLATATTARADFTVISSLTGANDGPDEITASNGTWLANEFVTGTNAAGYSLSSVTISMGAANNAVGAFVMEIFSNNAGLGIPGTLLQTLTGNANPSTAGNYTYTATSLNLNPSTIYWLVEGVTSGAGSYNDTFTVSPGSYLNQGWSLPGTFTTGNAPGAGWNISTITSGPTRFSLQIVPEPAESALAFGVVGLAAVMVQRRKRAAFVT